MWHVYEPVSFDLMSPKGIVEKANKRLGRGTALHDSLQRFRIHFLLGEPKSAANLKAFEKAHHLMRKIPGTPELIRKASLAGFAEKVADEIARHDEAGAPVLREGRRRGLEVAVCREIDD